MTPNPIQLLRDMITIPSVNPMRSEVTEPVETELVNYIENVLHRYAIDFERQEVAKGRDNLIAIVPASDHGSQRKGLMLNTHLDTVPVANMTIDPFDPKLEDGRVYGRGACDAKGSLAAMITTLISYSQQAERSIPLVLAAMVDEEYSFAGSWKLIEKEWPVEAAVVGEPTMLNSIVAHKGVARWRARVRGISAHGATPHLGRSAIYDGARVALALENFAQELSRRDSHSLLGPPTLNVGRITGGNSVNIVPDSCDFEIERRVLPGENAQQVVDECELFVREHTSAAAEVEFETPYLTDPPLETNAEAQIVRLLSAAHHDEFGVESVRAGAHYGTDGSKLSRAGIETVVCGPGDIAQAHTCDEFIEIDQVERAVRLYSRLVNNWWSAEVTRVTSA